MDAFHSTHPTTEILRAYSLGNLDDASAEAVGRHVEQCPECRRLVAEMAPDTFLDKLRDIQAGPMMSASCAESPAEARTAGARSNVAEEATGEPVAVGPTTASERTTGLPADPSGGQPEATLKDDPTLDHAAIQASPAVPDSGQTGVRDSLTDDGLERGTRVRYFGDYELLKVLGEGGMGIVYKARQISLNRPVALKMIRASRFPSADDLRRFQNEAEAVARLDHPNIVPIFEVGQYEQQHYFSMKLIAGESLDKRSKEYLVNPRRTAEILATTAGAIHHAHQRGILHRDLKPANVLVDTDGQSHVTDFGLAKRVEGDSELTRSGAILGTPAFMAPEQASGKRGAVTTATDVYGLGAVLYVLLTGSAPFGGDTVIETLEQVRERLPEPPTKRNPRVARDLEVICMKCLEKDARRRYASADAVAEDLKRWLAGKPIAARPVGNAARLWMWCRRNPMLAGAAGLVAAALLVLTVLSLLYARQQRRLADARTLYANEQSRRAREQNEAATKIADLNTNLAKEGRDLKTALADSNRGLSMLRFDRAQRAFDHGEVGVGLLWLAETWASAVEAGDRDLQRLARANLSCWRSRAHVLKGMLEHDSTLSYVAFSPDARTVVTKSGASTIRLWDTATARTIGLPIVHKRDVPCVTFSPDGRTLVTTCFDKAARLWDAATARRVGEPMAHDDYVSSAAFSPDAKTILTESGGGVLRLWDAATSRPIGVPRLRPLDGSASFSPDGKIVLVRGHTAAWIWDAGAGNRLGRPLQHEDQLSVLVVSPDGKTILTGSLDGTARLWNATSSDAVGEPMVHQAELTCGAFSPDGRTVLTGCRDKTTRLWDASTGKPLSPPTRHQEVVGLAGFSPDGKTLFSGSAAGTGQLRDAGSLRSIGQPIVHQGAITCWAFSPDSRALVTASADKTACLWDASTARPIGLPMVHRSRLLAVGYSPNGNVIISKFDATLGFTHAASVLLWDALTARPVGVPVHVELSATNIAFSANGRLIATAAADKTVRLWEAAMGQPAPTLLQHKGRIRHGKFSSDGRTVQTTSSEGSSQRWDVNTGRPIDDGTAPSKTSQSPALLADNGRSLADSLSQAASLSGNADLQLSTHRPPSGQARPSAYGPDRKYALRLGIGNTAVLETVATLPYVCGRLEHQGRVLVGVFSPDGKTVLSGSYDGTARLWKVPSAAPVGPAMLHEGEVSCAAFSPAGDAILTGSADGAARMWDARSGRPVGRPMVQGGQVKSLAFSPDGKTIATGSSEHTAQLWDVATTLPIGPPLPHQGSVEFIAFSPDATIILTGSDDNTARLWRIPKEPPDDVHSIATWVEATTGLELDEAGNARSIDAQSWPKRRALLDQSDWRPGTDGRWFALPAEQSPSVSRPPDG